MDSEKKDSFGGDEEEVVYVNVKILIFDFFRRGGNSDGDFVPISTKIWGGWPNLSKLGPLKICAYYIKVQ